MSDELRKDLLRQAKLEPIQTPPQQIGPKLFVGELKGAELTPLKSRKTPFHEKVHQEIEKDLEMDANSG